ncbi:hypothetical protein [Microcoleus sp. B4-D4]
MRYFIHLFQYQSLNRFTEQQLFGLQPPAAHTSSILENPKTPTVL